MIRFNRIFHDKSSILGCFFGNILISLTFGDEFSHSLVNVTLPNILHDQSLEGVTFPHSLQNLTFGSNNRANPVAGCICRV